MSTLPGLETLEQRAAVALCRCTMLPGCWANRFAADMNAKLNKGSGRLLAQKPITAKQRTWLWKLVWSYRKQIKDRELIEAAIAHLGDATGDKALVDLVEGVSG